MEVTEIRAEKREAKGTKATNRLRAAGRVPAIMYGGDTPNEMLSLDAVELATHLRHHHRVFRVHTDSGPQVCFLHDVDFDAMTDQPRHLDLLRIDLNKPMAITVEVLLVGHPAGLSKGGVLVRDVNEMRIKALPTAIPDHIEVKIDALDIGNKVQAKDVALPVGVELDMSPEQAICHVIAPSQASEEPEGAAGEGAAEGEAAPAEGSDD